MLRQIVLLVVASVMLIACSEQTSGFKTFSEGQQALQTINNLLSTQEQQSEAASWPFSESYLQARHQAYQGLKTTTLDVSQQAQLNYLIIAERYPERYFVWPVQRDVIRQARLVNDYSVNELANWLELVETQLIAAEQSNLKLNKIELTLLHNMVKSHLDNSDDSVQAALNKLNQYLTQYKPRTKLGLVGLANGKDWYQSKLNYFSGETKPPLTWLSEIQASLKQSQNADFVLPVSDSHAKPLVMNYFVESHQHTGLDWQLDYLDPLKSKRKLTQDEQYFWQVMMETDLGIHYHTWSEQQARVSLMKRLGVNQQQADWLIEDIVLYPAMSFIFIN
ncbi:MAG: hypothetical protein VYB81_13775 [Pseudomonadota bacterium]|nr:hypothetical protein [Pseudomonadota bacterium]